MTLRSSLTGRRRLVLLVGLSLTAALTVRTSGTGTERWTNLAPSNPPQARFFHTLVSDSANDRAIVFGGAANCGPLRDVWLLTNASGLSGPPAWSQLTPTGTGPDARYAANAVYDAANNRMIVFGGAAGGYCSGAPPLRNDVWVLTNANGLGGAPAWIQLSPAGSLPTARAAMTTVYDPSSNRLIVFGGNRNVGNCFFETNETWILTFANGLGGTPQWINANPSGGPPTARFQHVAVYDPSANQMIVFGGQDSCPPTTAFADAWALVNANGVAGTPRWVSLGNAPSAETTSTAVLDAARHRMLTFGGSTPGLTNTVRAMSNTNTTTGQTWTTLTPTGTPPSPRYAQGAVFDDVRQSMMVFGGNNNSVVLNDTWIFSLGPAATSVALSAAPGSFGGTTTLQATLSSANGPVGGMPVNFSLFGAAVGSSTTAGNGVATLSNLSLSGHTAGVFAAAAGASFAGTASYQSSSTTTDLLINQAATSFSVTGGGTFPYDGSTHSASGFVTGVLGESLGAASISYTDQSNGSTSSAAPMSAGSYLVTASYAGDTNYLAGSKSSITIAISQAQTSTALQTWSQLAPAGPGPAFGTYGSAEVYDGAGRLIVVTADSSNTFVLSAPSVSAPTPTWTAYSAPGHPQQKNAAAAYDPNTNTLMLYGGCGGGCFPITNQVWVLAHANGVGGAPAWSLLPTTGGPPAGRQAMARGYDPNTHRLVIFGGQNGGGSGGATSPDVWVLTNADGSAPGSAWVRLLPDNAPAPGQWGPSSWYDASSNRLIVAGGGAQGSGTPTNAVWALTNANGLGGTPHWINLIPEGAAGSPSGFVLRPAAYDAADNRAMIVEYGTSNLWVITNANGLGGAAAYNRVTLAAAPATLTDNIDAPYDAANHRLAIVSAANQVFVLGSADATGSINPSTFGQPVTFTATVSPLAPGDGTPTGTVTFTDGGAPLGSANVNAFRQATFTTSSLSSSGSPHAIGAAYAGDTNFTTSSASPYSQVVTPAPGPTAAFTTIPNPAACSQSVVFNGDGSSASGGVGIAGYAWNFGDGASGSGSSVAHAYASFGTFTATLTVTDNNVPAKTATATHAIDVSAGNQPPVANAGGPYAVDLGAGVTLNGTGSSDPNAGCGDSIVSYSWKIDGVIALSGQTPTLTDTQISALGAGSHTAALTVTDSFGASSSASASLTIYNNTTAAAFTATPNPAACSAPLAFDGTASHTGRPDRAIVSYSWNFGDGASGSGSSVTHAYASFGTFAATLTVTDNNTPAKTATATQTINVSLGNQPPVANAGGTYSVNFGGSVQLNGSNSSDPNTNCGDQIVRYDWTIDGAVHLSGRTPTLDTTVNSLSVGGHIVSLTVTDTFGATSTALSTVNVQRVLVSIAVTPPTATMHPGQSGQQFTATGTYSDQSTAVLQSGGSGGGSSGGTGNAPNPPIWSIHFTPGINVDACVTTTPVPGGFSSQSFVPDPTGAIHVGWSPATPIVQVDGQISPAQVIETLTCTDGAGAAGSIVANWTGTLYAGTYTFNGHSGQVAITGWSRQAPMPTPRFSVAALSSGGKVYAIGGVGGSCGGTGPCPFAPLTTVESYDPSTNTWMTEPALNVGREGAGVVSLGAKLYAIGGHVPGGEPSAVVEMFDPSISPSWITLPESEWMPTARAYVALVTDGTYLYALGGATQSTNGGPTAAVERYDPSSHSWTALAPMPVPGDSIAGVLGGTIVVAGGGGTSRTDVYDIATNTWHDGVPMPAQRGSMAAAVANGGLWVIGGTINGSLTDITWVYYPATDTRPEGWASLGSMPTARWALSAAAIGDNVYAIGGATDSSGAFLGLSANESLSTPPFGDLSTSQTSPGPGSSTAVQWQSTDPSAADVDSNGFAHANGLGHATIVASVGNISGTATVAVSNAAPAVRITGRLGGPLPLPAFAPGPFAIDEGAQLQLNADASDGDGDQLTYAWSILSGSGTLGSQGSSTSNQSLNYSNGDGTSSATIQVVVTDSFGATATATTTITVNNVAPRVQTFTGPFTTNESQFTNFGAGASFFDPGTSDGPWIVTADYGDGTPTQTLSYTTSPTGFGTFGNFSLSHSYGDNGHYTVTLRATDKDHDTGSATIAVTVNNVAPQVFLPATASTQAGSTNSFTCASFNDPGTADSPWTATVNYGDGTGDQAVVFNVPGSCGGGSNTGALNLIHAFSSGGIYTVTLNVTDKDHATGTATTQVSVNAPPSVTIDAPLGPVNEGSTVTGSGSFTDASTDGPWTISVNYGDNSGQPILPQTSSPFTLNHVYRDNGTYTVTVLVTDKFFATGTTSTTVTVRNVVPSVTLPSSAGPVSEGQSVFFTANFTDAGKNDNQSPGFSATVNFGDGTILNRTNLGFSSQSGQGSFSLNHTYADNPAAPSTTFTVTVTVTDKDGGTSAAATMPVTVSNTPPGATLTGGVRTLEGHPAIFSGVVFDQGANDGPWTGTVNYGDGSPVENLTLINGTPPNSPQNTRASFASTHTYAHAGAFTLTLTATDKDGAIGTATFPINVKPVLVALAITPNPVFMNAPGRTVPFVATATFSDGSAQSTDGQVIDGVAWSSSNPSAATIGPGGAATAVSPGTTTITVTARDDSGAIFTAHAALTVDFAPPIITASDVSAEATSAAGATVSFSISAADDFDPHPAVVADHASGAPYALGTTNVVVTATDAAGNSSTKTFRVIVVDTTKPTLALPAEITVDATSPAGAVVSYSASASDAVSGTLAVACVPLSGTTFPIGTTTATCTAVDGAGNSASGDILVHVQAAATQVTRLIVTTQSFNLAQGIENSLDTKLQNILSALAGAKNGNVGSVCSSLGAFTNETIAQSGKKLTVDQANQLLAASRQIGAVIGCQ